MQQANSFEQKPPPQSAHKQSIALHLPHKEKTDAEGGSNQPLYCFQAPTFAINIFVSQEGFCVPCTFC